MDFFIESLNNEIINDFQLDKIITEKKHILETNRIEEMLNSIHSQIKPYEKTKDNSFKEWIITDEQGKTAPLIKGKLYSQKYSNGVETQFMFKEGKICVDFLDIHGQRSYVETDIEGKITDTKFPYELTEYKLSIPKHLIIHKDIFQLPNGLRREITKLKWNKEADVVYNAKGQLVKINLSGGWQVKNLEKIIIPD